MFEDLMMNSIMVYGDTTVHNVLVTGMTDDLIDKILYREDFGELMNIFYDTNIYPDGDIEDLMYNGITTEQLAKFDSKIAARVNVAINNIFDMESTTGVGKRIGEFYNINTPELLKAQTMKEISNSGPCIKSIFVNDACITTLFNFTYFKNTIDSMGFYNLLASDIEFRESNFIVNKLKKTTNDQSYSGFILSIQPTGKNYGYIDTTLYYSAKSGYTYTLSNDSVVTVPTVDGGSNTNNPIPSNNTGLSFAPIIVNTFVKFFKSINVGSYIQPMGYPIPTPSTTYSTTFTYISIKW